MQVGLYVIMHKWHADIKRRHKLLKMRVGFWGAIVFLGWDEFHFVTRLFSNSKVRAVSSFFYGAPHSGRKHPFQNCYWKTCAPSGASSRPGCSLTTGSGSTQNFICAGCPAHFAFGTLARETLLVVIGDAVWTSSSFGSAGVGIAVKATRPELNYPHQKGICLA